MVAAPPLRSWSKIMPIAGLLALGVWRIESSVQAQTPLERNDFIIDLVSGPVLSSGRIVGLGGAYTAVAEGIDAAPFNPAGYASRTPWEMDSFEWEVTGSWLFPGSFSDNDFYNTGSQNGFRFGDFLFFTVGLRFQIGHIGFGSIARLSQFRLTAPETGDDIDASFVVGNLGIAYQLLDGQFVLGVGARTADFRMGSVAGGESLVEFSGTGPEVGALLRLADQPFRLGLSARAPVRSTNVAGGTETTAGGVHRSAGFILPDAVYMPWEIQLGAALQIGERPLNRSGASSGDEERALIDEMTMRRFERERAQVFLEMGNDDGATDDRTGADPYRWLPKRASNAAWRTAETARRQTEDAELEAALAELERVREREVRGLSRRYLLLSADVRFTAPTARGIGIEDFLAQERRRAGGNTTVALHLGVEGEPWQNTLKLRAGTYLEPSRYADVPPRLHGTGGLDVRLFSWDAFGLLDEFDVRVGASADLAPRYFDWGLGIGLWH